MRRPLHLLLVEDNPGDVRLTTEAVCSTGLHCTLDVVGDGERALDYLRRNPPYEQASRPDLVLLDLNLPGMDGLDVAREIRRKSNVPILMMTARVEETDQVIGLELGADDYITKPFSPRVVVARVRAALRRSEAPAEAHKLIHAADLEIDPQAFRLLRAGQEIELTPTEFNLLAALASQPGRAFTRLQLLEDALGTAYEGYERTIDAHIKNLRAKLEPDPRKPRYVLTVFGVGVFSERDESIVIEASVQFDSKLFA